ncbi:MAG TPA: metallophosphoesterase, partial [Methylobacterium sp.]
TDLVVSGGLGMSGLPVRFGMPPEIVVVELTGGPTA